MIGSVRSMPWIRPILTLTVLIGIGGLCLLRGVPAGAWPAAALETRDENCTSCHEPAGRWTDTAKIVIDIIDPETGESFGQPDGSFEITVPQGGERRVKTVLGVRPGYKFPPDMVGWLYVSPMALESAHESDLKFAPGWQVNRPFCGKRLVEKVEGYPGQKMAAITMTLRPLAGAEDATVDLHVLLRSSARGMEGDYFDRSVRLIVAR